MAKLPDPSKGKHLNPFAFPSETDARFLLLVMIVPGTMLGWTALMIEAATGTASEGMWLVVGVCLVVVVFAWTWLKARGSAAEKIREQHWQVFPPPDSDPAKQISLRQMEAHIKETVASLPNLGSKSPKFIWDDSSKASRLPTGMAFGFGRNQYVCLREGLHDAFVTGQFHTLHTVLLHELGHVANRDVSKTAFSIALGECFFRTAFVLLVLLNLILVYGAFQRVLMQDHFDSLWRAGRAILAANVKFLLLLALVEIVRSSVLRVREYYADARARAWMGRINPLLKPILERSEGEGVSRPAKKQETPSEGRNQSQNVGVWPKALPIWRWVGQQFRARVAPLHPNSKRRAAKLTNTRRLFEPSFEVAFLCGLLSGLVANSSLILMIPLMSQLYGLVEATDTTMAGLIAMLLILTTLLGGFLFLLAFGFLPVVGTVGLQIQKSTFADRIQSDGPRLLPGIAMIKLALMLSIGMMVGFALTPSGSPLSLMGRALLLTPFYVVGWAGVFFLWMLPLRWLAGQVFGLHTGHQPPNAKRRWLTILSALALLPLLGAMSWSQVTLSAFVVAPNPDTLEILAMTPILGLVAFALNGAVWVGGWFVLSVLGWLRQSADRPSFAMAIWAWLPPPCRLPAPPPKVELTPQSSAPPL